MTAPACADAVRRVVHAQCGVEFANFLADKLRMDQTKQRSVLFYDIRGGLLPAKKAVLKAKEHLPGDLAKKASSLSRSVTKLLARHEGPGKVPAAGLPKFRQDVEKLQRDFHAFLQEIRKGCGAAPEPPVGERR